VTLVRNVSRGDLLHVVANCVDRAYLLDLPGVREQYLRRLGDATVRRDWRVFGYALMSSHVHVVVEAGGAPFETVFASLHGPIARWINGVRGGLGSVFANEPYSVTFPPEAMGRVLAYVHNNPVRAGVVADARRSRWTSHGAFVRGGTAPRWLDVGRALAIAGFEQTAAGRRAFGESVLRRSGERREDVFGEIDTAAMGRAARSALGTTVRVAHGTLVAARDGGDAGARLESPVHVRSGAVVRERYEGDLREVARHAAAIIGVSLSELSRPTRVRRVVEARRVALIAATRHLGRTAAEMAAFFGISSPAASKLTRWDSANDPERDAVVASVARLCRGESTGLRVLAG